MVFVADRHAHRVDAEVAEIRVEERHDDRAQRRRVAALPQGHEFGAGRRQRGDQAIEAGVFGVRRVIHAEHAQQVQRAVLEIRVQPAPRRVHERVPDVVVGEWPAELAQVVQPPRQPVPGQQVEHRIQYERRRLVQVQHLLGHRRQGEVVLGHLGA